MSARSRRVARTFVRHALIATWKARLGLRPPAVRRAVFAREIRIACEELGPTFIKLGQIASVRPDLFSAELVFELEKLQDSVAPVPTEEIRRRIRRDLGREPEALFAHFDPVPVASASIAQVHRAILAHDYLPVHGERLAAGSTVAVKVVRPGVERLIAEDLAVARRLVARFGGLGPLARVPLARFVDEFEESLSRELDVRNEGRVADRFAFDFREDPLVVVPRVVWTHSSRGVLTMEFVEGWRLSELDAARRSGVDAYALALHGAEVFMRQVLVLGRFHADLHPANLFVTPDGRICYLDFGITGRTAPHERIAIAQVLAATVYGDADRALRYSRELGLEIPAAIEPAVRERVARLLAATMRGPGPSDVRGFAVGFLSMLADFRISVPAGYGLLVKALVTVEGVSRALYPEIDIAQAARPFATRLIAEEFARPQHLRERLPAMLDAALGELTR